MVSLLLFGFLLGMGHATDADHVLAVTTIVARHRAVRPAALIGVAWGIGHTLTIFAVGGAIIALQLAVPPRLALAMELAVAVMLIVLGVRNLARRPGDSSRAVAVSRPLIVGVVHGLAGSAAVALVVVAAVPAVEWAALYLLLFGVGTIAGMIAITTAMAAPLAYAAARVGRWHRAIERVTGLASVAFGAFLVVRIGLMNGVFALHPFSPPR